MRQWRRWAVPLVVVIFEAWLYNQYAALGAQFHYWLHGLFGGALGAWAATAVVMLSRRRTANMWSAGVLGHLYSALPDVLFLAFGTLHYLWMDVFAVHISLHFIPAPLATMFAVFAVSVGSWAAAVLGRRPVAGAGMTAAVLITAVAVVVREPIPDTLQEVRAAPGIAVLCPLTTNTPR